MKRYMDLKKNSRNKSLNLTYLKKPFGFCCDISHQDPITQYNMRNPPFESAFEQIPLIINIPDVQFRIQDNVRTPIRTVPRSIGVYREDIEIKKAATYGRSKKGRGPLLWFIEDEIDVVRDAIAEEKKIKWEMMHTKITNKHKNENDIEKNEISINNEEHIDVPEIENVNNEIK